MPVSEPGNMRPLINKIVNTKYGSVAVPQTTIPENLRYLFKCQRNNMSIRVARNNIVLLRLYRPYLPDDLTPLNKLKYSMTYTMNTHSASCHFG